MDEDQVLRQSLEIARTRFPDAPHIHAPFAVSVLYLTSGGRRYYLPDLGHEWSSVWEQAVFRRFPSERLPEGGASFERAIRMIARSRVFERLCTRHWRCWWQETFDERPSDVRTFSRD